MSVLIFIILIIGKWGLREVRYFVQCTHGWRWSHHHPGDWNFTECVLKKQNETNKQKSNRPIPGPQPILDEPGFLGKWLIIHIEQVSVQVILTVREFWTIILCHNVFLKKHFYIIVILYEHKLVKLEATASREEPLRIMVPWSCAYPPLASLP